MKQFIRYVLSALLTISLIILVLVSLISSTILNEEYVLRKLEETNYYSNIYETVKSNFENYIYQSGLDENVLNDIVSQEKVKEDTKLIISHIYNGLEEKIDAETIKKNLNSNIDKSLKNIKLSDSQKKAIETFVDTVTDEYADTILHFGFEKDIYTVYHNISKYVEFTKKAMLVSVASCLIILVLITLRRFYRIFNFAAISSIATGTFLIIVNQVINAKINVGAISILNDAISLTLRAIASEILQNMMSYGCILIIVGVITIILANLLHNIKKYKKAYKIEQED